MIKNKQRFGLSIHRLLVHGRKILVFAVLRKSSDAQFTVPIQLRYTGDVSATDLERSRSLGVGESPRPAGDTRSSVTGANAR